MTDACRPRAARRLHQPRDRGRGPRGGVRVLRGGPSACLPPRAVAAGAVLLAAGLAVSARHLGQKRRGRLAAAAPGAARSATRRCSPGSRWPRRRWRRASDLGAGPCAAVTALAGVISAAFLVSIGLVYRIRGQRTWRGFSVATPLTGGLAFGAIAVQSIAPGPAACLAATPAVLSRSTRSCSPSAGGTWRGIASHGGDARRIRGWSAAVNCSRHGSSCSTSCRSSCCAVSPTPLAVLVAAAGLVVDRFGFYALAVQHTTEHEVADVARRRSPPFDRTARGLRAAQRFWHSAPNLATITRWEEIDRVDEAHRLAVCPSARHPFGHGRGQPVSASGAAPTGRNCAAVLKLATTTSTVDTGLFRAILPGLRVAVRLPRRRRGRRHGTGPRARPARRRRRAARPRAGAGGGLHEGRPRRRGATT